MENPSGTCIYVETIMQVALTGASVSHKICVHKTVTVIDLLLSRCIGARTCKIPSLPESGNCEKANTCLRILLVFGENNIFFFPMIGFI